MATTGGARRRWGAVLAAYLIVVQAVLTSLALGAMPATADPLSVICNSAGLVDSGQSPANGHAGLPLCCIAGCVTHAGGMAPAPDPIATPAVPQIARLTLAFRAADSPRGATERTPRSTRAPPANG